MNKTWSFKRMLFSSGLVLAILVGPNLPGFFRTGGLPAYLPPMLLMTAAMTAGAVLLLFWLDARKAATPPEQRRSRRRSFRRAVVLAMYGAWVASSAWVLALPEARASFIGSLLVMVAEGGGMRWLRSTTFVALPENQTDERQLAARDRAYRVAYNIVYAYAAAIVITLVLAGYPPAPRGYLHTSLIWIVLMPVVTLPGAVLAWTEPDDIAPDAA